MDLSDPRPRWVAVRFENSPSDQPGRLTSHYTPTLPGWFEAGDLSDQVRVTIAGSDVETRWFYGQRLRPGSFSDFVWVFDASSGEVISARLRGTLIRRFDTGVFRSDFETRFETEMTTRAIAGFEAGLRRFGQLVFPFCTREAPDCTLVTPVRYDRGTGYVNAVGSLVGRAMGVAARTFSPLGEAIFAERGDDPGPRDHLANAR